MEREELMKRSWKAYQVIHYKAPRMPESIQCLLTEVDFDGETMTLMPLNDNLYAKQDITVNVKFCSVVPVKNVIEMMVEERKSPEEIEKIVNNLKIL